MFLSAQASQAIALQLHAAQSRVQARLGGTYTEAAQTVFTQLSIGIGFADLALAVMSVYEKLKLTDDPDELFELFGIEDSTKCLDAYTVAGLLIRRPSHIESGAVVFVVQDLANHNILQLVAQKDIDHYEMGSEEAVAAVVEELQQLLLRESGIDRIYPEDTLELL